MDKSCLTNLTAFLWWFDEFGKERAINVIYLNCKKAFDTVFHNILTDREDEVQPVQVDNVVDWKLSELTSSRGWWTVVQSPVGGHSLVVYTKAWYWGHLTYGESLRELAPFSTNINITLQTIQSYWPYVNALLSTLCFILERLNITKCKIYKGYVD